MSVIINNISFQGRTLLSSSGSTANFSISISGNESNYNLLTALVSAGYNGTDIITVNVTINRARTLRNAI